MICRVNKSKPRNIISIIYISLQVIPGNQLGIINGNEVKAHSNPFQVYVEAEYIFFEQSCTGSLITNRDVITTARCVVGFVWKLNKKIEAINFQNVDVFIATLYSQFSLTDLNPDPLKKKMLLLDVWTIYFCKVSVLFRAKTWDSTS